MTLRLRPEARWATEHYPVDRSWSRATASLEATFAVLSERWLERLLLRAGTDAAVVAPSAYRPLGALAARRLLAKYERSASDERSRSPGPEPGDRPYVSAAPGRAAGRSARRTIGRGGAVLEVRRTSTVRSRPVRTSAAFPPQVGGGPLRAGGAATSTG